MLSYLPPNHKVCPRCGESKPRDTGFGARNTGATNAYCRSCAVVRANEWAAKNRDRMLATQRDRYAADAARRRAYQRGWSRANAASRAESNKRWGAKNPEKLLAAVHARRARLTGAMVDAHVTRAWLRARDGDNCYYCGIQMVFGKRCAEQAQIEHKQPISRGGAHSEANCVLACRTCNYRKGSMTEEEFAC